MLDAFRYVPIKAYYAQNYAGIIGRSLLKTITNQGGVLCNK